MFESGMFESGKINERVLSWRWPAIALVGVLSLAAVQCMRVNPPGNEAAANEPQQVYTQPGPIVDDQITIPAKAFHSSRMNLNRRLKLTGDFRTAKTSSRVSVLVLTEENFEKWKAGSEYRAVVQTNSVPRGKINPVLEPGVYVLVVDNRQNENDEHLFAQFTLGSQ